MKIIILTALLLLCELSFAQRYVENSVLKDGTIYKVGVVEDGMYLISFDELYAAGIDVSALQIDNISLFGNVNGVLPESNSSDCYDDLTEMSICVDENGIVFYGQNPAKWTLTNGYYKYNTNYYSDTTFYFLKINNVEKGRRMAFEEESQEDYNEVVTSFLDKKYHEKDLHNHYHRGRKWYGETLNGGGCEPLSFSFEFKNADVSQPAFLELGFVGASKTENFYLNVSVNDVSVLDDVFINKAGTYAFGVEKVVGSEFAVDSDIVNVSLSSTAENNSSIVGVDFISVNAWRSLRYENEQLNFGLINGFGLMKPKLIKIDNAASDMLLYDVTDPLNPMVQRFTAESNGISFRKNAVSNSFVLLNDDDFLRISSIRLIENQNLHSLKSADMLIITDKVFSVQADEIRDIHESEDGLLCEVVFIDEIFNEFSSGSRDITGLRNFIRMVYSRDSELKYVLLLGRGTNDYKDIEGYGGNFIPPYEASNSVNEITAYVSDDYFGLLDMNEGEDCYGKMDVGVGRIPVLTSEEADIVVGKIRKHIDKGKTFGAWRHNMLFVSDDSKEYSKNCDAIESIIATLKPSINIDKVYADAFVREVNASGAYCYPSATASILEKFEEGIMMMTYVGHGGVQGLSNSNLFRIKDIAKLTNEYSMPFVITGTCEFSAFDDASFVSAGERLFKMEGGGAIAMYTSTRPTVSSTNFTILKSIHNNFFQGDNIRTLRFGDFARLTKGENASNSSNYVSYVLFGDPALRFDYPKKNIKVSEVNTGTTYFNNVLSPMDSVVVQGFIEDDKGDVDYAFNGYLYPKMFDNISVYNTLNNSGTNNNNYSFKCYSDVIYEGKVSVKDGFFSFSFIIPRSVNNHKGNARLSLYAVDTIRDIDANGYYDAFIVGGVSTNAPDAEGPEITMLWNGQEEPGTDLSNEGVLTAKIFDPQGIYHYGTTLGRDIVLVHETESGSSTVIVNKYFTPQIDSYTSGQIDLAFENLEEGRNVFTLRAWDLHDNSNQETFVVNVARTPHEKRIKNVRNYPNPFSGSTVFTVDYNNANPIVEVVIDIFDVMGRRVNTLYFNDVDEMEWNGCDNMGRTLDAGTYLYKVSVSDCEGNHYQTNQILIISR
ncbi:MAG: type IX secretion system sortase PorU [Candidatus Limimorpha sp.]